jgi:uncharacterized protein YndB with AHSA1/START domain
MTTDPFAELPIAAPAASEPAPPTSEPAPTSGTVERSVDLDAPAEVVWSALTDDGAISAWFGGDVTLDPVPGGEGRFDGGDGDVRRARVDEVEPNRRLSWRWWPEGDDEGPITAVTFELVEVAAGTRVVVTERPLLLGTRGVVASALSLRLPGLQAHLALLVRA